MTSVRGPVLCPAGTVVLGQFGWAAHVRRHAQLSESPPVTGWEPRSGCHLNCLLTASPRDAHCSQQGFWVQRESELSVNVPRSKKQKPLKQEGLPLEVAQRHSCRSLSAKAVTAASRIPGHKGRAPLEGGGSRCGGAGGRGDTLRPALEAQSAATGDRARLSQPQLAQ